MLTERLKARVSSASSPTPYALRRYRLRFHKKSVDCSGKCNIVATTSDADVVHGVIFDIADEQICALDKAEGCGSGYRRAPIILNLDGICTTVFVYIAENDAIDEALVPYRWYYDLVLAGAEQHALPADYVAELQAFPFIKDPRPDRKSRLEALVALKKYEDSKVRHLISQPHNGGCNRKRDAAR